jgi:hypothetical protein
MAKVKITGHASGTGVLTITAPNTSTDRTVTLPDSTGTLLDTTSGLDATKLSGNLPAISGASLTSVNAVNSGRKNMVYNGAMQVAQRGTTAALNSAASTYQLDRWNFYWRTGPAATITQSTDVPSGGGFAYSQKIDVTTGDAMGTSNDLAKFCQKLEGINLQHLAYGTSSAKSLTLSFWIKSTITGTYFVQLNGLDANRFNTVSYNVNSSNTWEKKTVTFSGDTSSTIQNTTGNDLELRFWLALGPDYKQSTTPINTWTAGSTNWGTGQVNAINSASNNIYFTGVQLEVGSVATDFEHRSYGEELALCQRYCYKTATGVGNSMYGIGFVNSSTSGHIVLQYPVSMRAAPSFTASGSYSILHNQTAINVSVTMQKQTTDFARVDATGSGFTVNGAFSLRNANDANAYLLLDAEL